MERGRHMLQGRPVDLGELTVLVNTRNKKISHVISHHVDRFGHAGNGFLLNRFRAVEFALLGFALGLSFASLRRTLAGRESQTKFLRVNINQGKAGLSRPPLIRLATWILIRVIQRSVIIILRFGHANRLESGVQFDVSFGWYVELLTGVDVVPDHGSYPIVLGALRLQVALSDRSMLLIEDICKRMGFPR